MSVERERRSKLSNIRTEMSELKRISLEERDVLRSYGAQLSALQRDLALVKRQTDFEIRRRNELAAQLETERHAAVPKDQLEALHRREEEIRSMKDERTSMVEWLQRGVNEAQRITMQVATVKTGLDSSRANESDLNSDLLRLDQLKNRLEVETEETRHKIKRMEEAKRATEEQLQRHSSTVSVTTDLMRSTKSEAERAVTELEQLKSRNRNLETIEYAMTSMSAAVRRALHTLESLHSSVAKGEFPEDWNDGDDFDSDTEADATLLTPVVLSTTKAKIGRCDAILTTLWSSLRRFDEDQRSRTESAVRKHEAEVTKYRVETAEVQQEAVKEVEFLREDTDAREPMLRRFLELRTAALVKRSAMLAAGEEFEEEEEPFSLLEYIEEENENGEALNNKLREDKERLELKIRSLESDYRKVQEMKRQYRDLEAQKTMLSHMVRSHEAENAEYKFHLRENIVRATTKSNKRPPWKAVALN